MASPRQMTAHTLEALKGWPSPHAVDIAAALSVNATNNGLPVYAGRVVHLVATTSTPQAGFPGSNTSLNGMWGGWQGPQWPMPQFELGVRGGPSLSTASDYAGANAPVYTVATANGVSSVASVTVTAGAPNTNYVAGGAGQCDMPIFLFQNSDDPDVSNPGGNPATDPGAWVAVSPTGKMMGLVAAGAYELESTEYVNITGADVYLPGQPLTAINDNTSGLGGMICKGVAYTTPLVGVVSRGVRKNAAGLSALSFWPVFLPANYTGK